MTKMRYSQFLGAVESLIGEIVRRSYPASWNEDHITYSITDQLAAKFRRVSVVGFQRPFEILWDAWKLRGTPEKLLGDLAVIVKIKDCWLIKPEYHFFFKRVECYTYRITPGFCHISYYHLYGCWSYD